MVRVDTGILELLAQMSLDLIRMDLILSLHQEHLSLKLVPVAVAVAWVVLLVELEELVDPVVVAHEEVLLMLGVRDLEILVDQLIPILLLMVGVMMVEATLAVVLLDMVHLVVVVPVVLVLVVHYLLVGDMEEQDSPFLQHSIILRLLVLVVE